MGQFLANIHALMHLQTDNEGSDTVCEYLIALGLILLALYAALYIYNRFIIGRKVKQHPCRYCGHMVDVASKCCGAPVEERFMASKCSKCGKPTRTVCTTCKRELY